MKTKFWLVLSMLLVSSVFAQNFQLHYDLGEDREYFTSTIEMFKPDEYGATFFFVDFDYNQPGNKSISLAYFEIARYVTIHKASKLSATLQYNDGTAPWGPLGHIWLAGLSYPLNLGPVTINIDLLYRRDYLDEGNNAQLTLVWFKPLLNNKLTVTGFMDIWTITDSNDDKKMVLLTEPQVWYKLTNHLHVGSEIEISYRFLPPNAEGDYSLEFKPTVGLKWDF
ncbi:MAG: DUF5020 family protein [Calditrichia bacterium]